MRAPSFGKFSSVAVHTSKFSSPGERVASSKNGAAQLSARLVRPGKFDQIYPTTRANISPCRGKIDKENVLVWTELYRQKYRFQVLIAANRFLRRLSAASVKTGTTRRPRLVKFSDEKINNRF